MPENYDPQHRQYFKLSEEAKLAQQRQNDLVQNQEKEATETGNQKILEAVPTIFDQPDFFTLESRLAELQKVQGPKFVVFSALAQDGENIYTIERLRKTVEMARLMVEQKLQQETGLKPEEATNQFAQSFALTLGITRQKISEQSQLGFRESMIKCAEQLIRSKVNDTQLRKVE